MSSSAVKLFIFISCFLVADRIISGVASSVKTRRMKVEKLSEKAINLDMAPNSVDDQFHGCQKNAEKLVNNTHLPRELQTNAVFKQLWEANSKFNRYDRSLRIYTAQSNIFGELNGNMTNGRSDYKNGFNFKALHFFMTRAIQKRKRLIQIRCKTVYRRTNVQFNPVTTKSVIRFARFASASVISNKTSFGNKTCFQIKTCLGVDVSKISYFPNEKEVIIPPYEKFKVTAVNKNPNKMNCEVLYTVKSAGKCSNMNCEMLNKTSKKKCKRTKTELNML